MTNPFYIKFCYVLNLTEIHRQVTHKIRWNTFYCIPDVTSKTNRLKNYALPKRGFITSTDHRPTNQSTTNPPTNRPSIPYPPTHRPSDHRPTDPPTQSSLTQPTRSYFKDVINEEYSFCRTQTAEKIKNYTSVYYLFDE